jgi:hypothetical protein
MATTTNATPQKEEVPKKKGPETSPDSPPLDWPPQLAAAQLDSFPGCLMQRPAGATSGPRAAAR